MDSIVGKLEVAIKKLKAIGLSKQEIARQSRVSVKTLDRYFKKIPQAPRFNAAQALIALAESYQSHLGQSSHDPTKEMEDNKGIMLQIAVILGEIKSELRTQLGEIKQQLEENRKVMERLAKPPSARLGKKSGAVEKYG